MTTPRLYVSGPMSGYENFNYPAFHEASRKLRSAGFQVCNPAAIPLPCGCHEVPKCGVEHVWDEYIRSAVVAMLRHSDAVAVLPGWEHSRGARIEVDLARALHWEVQPVGFWLGEVALSRVQPGELLRARPEEAPFPPEYWVTRPASA